MTYTIANFPRMTAEQRTAIKQAIQQAPAFVSGEYFVADQYGKPKQTSAWLKDDIAQAAIDLSLDVDGIMTGAINPAHVRGGMPLPPMNTIGNTLAVDDDADPSLAATLEAAMEDSAAKSDLPNAESIVDEFEMMLPPAMLGDLKKALRDYQDQVEELTAAPMAPAPVAVEGAPRPAVSVSKGRQDTIKNVFELSSGTGRNYHHVMCQKWRNPLSPAIDRNYVYPPAVLGQTIAAINTDQPVWLYGDASTGKTSLARQIAARRGSGLTSIAMAYDTEFPALIGQRVIDETGAMSWEDGAFTRAIRTPGELIHIDEITAAPSGTQFNLQNAIEDREITIPETGERIAFADGVAVVVTDNTKGDGDSGGFIGTHMMNRAFRSRFTFVEVEAPSNGVLIEILQKRTGAPFGACEAVADLLERSRNAAKSGGSLSSAIPLRCAIAFCDLMLQDLPATDCFETALIGAMPSTDAEAARQICNAHSFKNQEWSDMFQGKADMKTIKAGAQQAQSASGAANDFTGQSIEL